LGDEQRTEKNADVGKNTAGECPKISLPEAHFSLLQTMIQSALESLVLLDRMFYLRGCGCSSHIRAVFDPTVSSRYICIVAA
uniref:Ovule protein n=1 Tax=Gongylonema pulchrum TaxID=637853 RepID=A0A183EE06_9BILA